LREALRSQAVKARRGVAAGGGGLAAALGMGEEDGAGALAAQPPQPQPQEQEQQPTQAKLGRLPKNARLIEAMAQHKNAKPKPKGWLLAVVDAIYKEGELAGWLVTSACGWAVAAISQCSNQHLYPPRFTPHTSTRTRRDSAAQAGPV